MPLPVNDPQSDGYHFPRHRSCCSQAAAETDFLNYYPLIVNEFAANSTLLELWVQAQDDALSRRGIPWQ